LAKFPEPDGLDHPQGDVLTVAVPLNAELGSRVNAEDTVGTGHNPAFPPQLADGVLIWDIPWLYRIAGVPWTSFDTANHKATMYQSGKAQIEKKGAGPFSKELNDPTSHF
jgi:hypothetical protein